MTDGEDAAVHAVQAPRPEPPVDRAVPDAVLPELRARHHAVLSGDEIEGWATFSLIYRDRSAHPRSIPPDA
jgi:hypothetical protein